ncbi:hypothetical protein VFPPC_17690 [Pochonia chlamydosporia 170]|uniref:Uncharacterized protein n=1 Tax=Pochonia chlamydosporia 170 TaxID=1380566 RepID=A0A219AS70_METCM|nr:hypothetical protein VFPPC_17690 [Pochonia chlamydosporia 170]OWT43134.1 hypothetical protein VFPPC_17690 [Pochonia chlamydosporia 170]
MTSQRSTADRQGLEAKVNNEGQTGTGAQKHAFPSTCHCPDTQATRERQLWPVVVVHNVPDSASTRPGSILKASRRNGGRLLQSSFLSHPASTNMTKEARTSHCHEREKSSSY